MMKFKKIIFKNNIEKLKINFDFIDVFSIINQIKLDGGIFIIKVDGERMNDEDIPNNSVIISGGLLQENYIRKDDDDLEKAVFEAVCEYEEKIWKKKN